MFTCVCDCVLLPPPLLFLVLASYDGIEGEAWDLKVGLVEVLMLVLGTSSVTVFGIEGNDRSNRSRVI